MSLGVSPTGDIFQRKIDEIFKELPNIFGITNDIPVSGYDDDVKDHENTLSRVFLSNMQKKKS